MRENKRLSIILFPALIVIDQLSKYIIRLRQPAEGGFYICNSGIAFGLSLVSTLSLLFCFFIFLLLLNLKFKIFNLKLILNFKFQISNYSKVTIVNAILIISGGLSNVVDRIVFGCVTDFIDLKIWPVFNLADVYITIGSIMLIISLCLPKSSLPRQSA